MTPGHQTTTTAGRVLPADPIARRDAYKAHHDAAYAAYTQATSKRQAAELRKSQLGNEIRTAMGTGADTADLEKALAQAEADTARYAQQSSAALDITKATDAHIQQLYREQFAAFAEEADGVSVAADIAVQEFLNGYQQAVTAWKAAADAWAPVCASVQIPGVPPFPVTEFQIGELMNGQADARPHGIEISGLPGTGAGDVEGDA
jgi:hypothetical protein